MKTRLTREGRLLGGYVSPAIVRGIAIWVDQDPERNPSMFIREAAREKLRREGIPVHEKEAA